ncbi:c-type cytochrome [Edaphobacter sp. HDX4]|uniref:c-type cytochrome n=1 Tax=Edaphobacter sp. HDX4 TaxID=2794064 RepID=UPI002FE676A3
MKHGLLAALFLFSGAWYTVKLCSVAEAQTPAPAPTQRAQRPQAYPDRVKAPQEVLDRGKATYGVSCAFCHGSDARGGEVGPNLLRSTVVLQDQSGELIAPIVHGARADKGMPRIELTDAQIQDVAAWLHSIKVASRTDPNENNIDIVRGDANAGETYFKKVCASCHSVSGDLKGFAAKMPTPKVLQQTWLLPDGGGGRGGVSPVHLPGLHIPPTTVTVTLPTGEKIDGVMTRIDDFYVGLQQADGTERGFSRMGDVPKVEIHDPLAPHRELLHKYTDKEIHDVTAYLVTLK